MRSVTKSVGVIAHRGLHHSAVENSRDAFDGAIEAAADGLPLGIEFDVRYTADGVAVLNHDEDCQGLLVQKHTYRQLVRRLGTAAPFRLDEAVALMVDSDLTLIDAELKVAGYTANTLAILDDLGSDRLVVSSFIPEVVAEAKHLRPAVRTGLLIDELEGYSPALAAEWVKRMVAVQADGLIPDQAQITAQLSNTVRGLGRFFGTYTVQQPEVLLRMCAAAEVDFICTDVPEAVFPEIIDIGSAVVA